MEKIKETNYETIKCIATLGIFPGYNFEKVIDEDTKKKNISNAIPTVSHLWQVLSDHFRQNNCPMVSAVIYPVNVVYSKEFGCMDNGEPCIKIESTMNPKFNTDKNKFISTFRNILTSIATTLHQVTVTMEVVDVKMTYIENNKYKE